MISKNNLLYPYNITRKQEKQHQTQAVMAGFLLLFTLNYDSIFDRLYYNTPDMKAHFNPFWNN